jgi:chorismate mutase/prephenate dehydratase
MLSFAMSLDAQERRIAYLGPPGTFTHAAARALFPVGARYDEAATIAAVFESVRRGDAELGVVPIENSSEGSVTQAADELIEGGVLIRREVILEITHCLLSSSPALGGIARVYSHPQALGQCRSWLAKNLAAAQLVPTASTAAAAREAATDPTSAAIGSALAGELQGVPILRERIQDQEGNATRFVVLATEDAPRTGRDRTTLVFSLRDGRGALRRVLEVFDTHDVNLTRIESRPSRQKAWDYVFLVDFEGHREDDDVKCALAALESRCPMVRSLGSYPRAPGI